MTEAPLEAWGLAGAPTETFAAIKDLLKKQNLESASVVLITDWQDRRSSARYAVLVRIAEKIFLSQAAFGPRFGDAGTEALQNLITLLQSCGATNFKESVLAPHEFARMLEYPNELVLEKLAANANPTDPSIYALKSA